MKKLRITLFSLLAVLLLAVAAAGVMVWRYASQDTVPEGVTVGRIQLGGMDIDDALALLANYEKSLLDRTITVRAPEPADDSKSWTVAELGYRAEFDEVRQALLRLREGSVKERVQYRYKFPKHFSL